MTIDCKKYSPAEIFALASAIRQEEQAFEWLLNNCVELAALCDILVYGNLSALKWIKENKYTILEAFLRTLDDDEDSFAYLTQSNCKEWAAAAQAADDNTDAKQWLIRFQLGHYVVMADSLVNQKNNGCDSCIGGYDGGFSDRGGRNLWI